ncbi:hypothetical protein AAT19DRAFT_16152 [Rhodotorula toruloides]|nr:hypothetical protein AAT19DRAFT_16152 [Rhodotorula toruloides]
MDTSLEDIKNKANAAYSKKNWQEAVALFGQAVDLEQAGPAKATLLAKRSAAYVRLENFESAHTDAALAASADPTSPLAQARIAEACIKLKDYEGAEQAYDRAIQLSPEGAARKRYKDAQKSAQRASRHEAAQTRQAPPPAPTPAPPRSIPSHTSSARNPRTAPPSAYSSTPRYQSARLQIYRPGTSWWDRVAAAVEKEGFKPESGGGVEVALAAWEVCEEGFARLHESVSQVQVAGMLQVTTSDNSPLVAFAECILTMDDAFHLTASPFGDMPPLTKISTLIEQQSRQGHLLKYIERKQGYSARQSIDDLTARLKTESRSDIRTLTASLILGRIFGSFVLFEMGSYSEAIEGWRNVLDLLEAGNAVWAHEALEERGKVFSPTILRGVRVALMNTIMVGHGKATTDSERCKFKLDEMEDLANDVLDEFLPDSLLAGKPPVYRTAWEASFLAYCLGYAYRAEAPLRDMRMGVPAIADLDAAREVSDWYDAATSAMPFDWWEKRTILWAGLRMRLYAGGWSVQELLDRVEEAKRVDEFASRFFGPGPSPNHARDLVLYCVEACDDSLRMAAQPTYSGPKLTRQSTIKPVPRLWCSPGFDRNTVLTKEFWERPEMQGDIGCFDEYRMH